MNLLSAIRVNATGNNDWTFGQIIAVLLLATPLLKISEYLYPGKSLRRHHKLATIQDQMSK